MLQILGPGGLDSDLDGSALQPVQAFIMSVKEPSVRISGGPRPLSAPVIVRAPSRQEAREEEGEDPTREDHQDVVLQVSRPSVGESTKRAGFSASDGMLEAAREALSNIEDLKKWVYDDSSKNSISNRVSAATKQRALRKTLLKIATTSHSLKALERKCEESRAQETELEAELRSKEESRFEALSTLNATAGELQNAVDDLKSLRDQYDVLEREKVSKDRKLEDLEERSRQNLEALDRLERAHEKTEREKEEVTQKYEKLLETERRLRLPDLRQALSSAVAKVAKYEKSIEQSQKIIAQVTADNLVFLTKFKDAEEKYRACDARREELQLMVDDQKGPWFDKIRSEIQKQVEGDRKTIHTLEAELTNAEQESRREIERLREEAEGLSRQNAELAEAKDAAEAKVRHHEGREKLREEREIKAAADFESLNQLLKDTLAENKVLRETINDERHSIADLTLESQDQKNAIEELRREVEAEREATKNAREALQKERWSLETQRRMNKELMSRKEEMEWKLMELTLGGPGADQAGAVIEGKADEKKKGGPGPEEGSGEGVEPTREPVAEKAAEAAEPAPHKDEAVESDFSYELLESEEKIAKQGEPAKEDAGSPSDEAEACETSGKWDDEKEKSVPLDLTESNLMMHRTGSKRTGAALEDEAEEQSAHGKGLTIKELEDTIVSSKGKHQELLDSIYPEQNTSGPQENPLEVHKRLVKTILGDETVAAIPMPEPGEPSSADATIASMLQESITECSSIGELEASIKLAKDEYNKMMCNFSSIVDGLKGEELIGGLANMPVLPENIQRMAEEQFADHWQITENTSETKEVIQASEVKVTDWLENKINDEWQKQFMPSFTDEHEHEG